MKTNRTEKETEEKFNARVRFNWGYHDAAQSVKMGWDCAAHFWGFAKQLGEKITCAADVLRVHFDKSYAQGWLRGYEDAKAGAYAGNSEKAWIAFTH